MVFIYSLKDLFSIRSFFFYTYIYSIYIYTASHVYVNISLRGTNGSGNSIYPSILLHIHPSAKDGQTNVNTHSPSC